LRGRQAYALATDDINSNVMPLKFIHQGLILSPSVLCFIYLTPPAKLPYFLIHTLSFYIMPFGWFIPINLSGFFLMEIPFLIYTYFFRNYNQGIKQGLGVFTFLSC
jgi:hypothetical protein